MSVARKASVAVALSLIVAAVVVAPSVTEAVDTAASWLVVAEAGVAAFSVAALQPPSSRLPATRTEARAVRPPRGKPAGVGVL
ncbi:hypothetical protein [Rhodococcus sp. Leaf258]|uniref:hypothetical protein n=1 Tax=Rhodococcus sp. Leaf258 TaxID=1736310 RepID=UPI0039DFDFEC